MADVTANSTPVALESSQPSNVSIPTTPTSPVELQSSSSQSVSIPPKPQVSAPQLKEQHDNFLGKAARFLLGKEVDYVDDGQGGVKAQPRPQKPGDLFRSILAGAILGGAAGSRSSGFAQGIGTGGAAVQEQQTRRDQQKFENAQQNQRAREEKRRTDFEQQRLEQEKVYQQAQIEHLKISDIRADSQIDLARQDEVDRKNELNTIHENAMVEKGAVPSHISVNGKVSNEMTASEVMAAKIKDPNFDQAPAGYYRIHVTKTDTAGLRYSGGNVVAGPDGKMRIEGAGWFDEQGNRVNLSDKTKVSFYDVPQDAMKSTTMVSGKELNKMAGTQVFADDDEKHPIQLGELLTLRDISTKNLIAQQDIRLKKEQVGAEISRIALETKRIKSEDAKTDKAAMMAAERELRDQMVSLTAQWKEAKSSFDKDEAARYDNLLTETRQELDNIRKKLYPTTDVTKEKGVSVPPPNINSQKIDATVSFVKTQPADQQESMINGSSVLTAEEKAEALKRLRAPTPTKPTPQVTAPPESTFGLP